MERPELAGWRFRLEPVTEGLRVIREEAAGTGPRVPWLTQRQPGADAVLLRDYPDDLVRVVCCYCPRAGRYHLAA